MERGLAAILTADVVGYSRLKPSLSQRHPDSPKCQDPAAD